MPCAASANGPSRSSIDRIRQKASSCCPGAGSSSERWLGSIETGASPRTSNTPSLTQPHGSSSPQSSSSPVESQSYEITTDNFELDFYRAVAGGRGSDKNMTFRTML